jgi:hypothetical protein
MKVFTPLPNPRLYSQILIFKSSRSGITLSGIPNIFLMKILRVHRDLLRALSCAAAFRTGNFIIKDGQTYQKKSAWRDRIANLLSSMDPYCILNADEINWLLFSKGLLSWALKSAASVPIHINGEENESLSVIATVTASGVKLPLQILAHGKTHHSQIRPVNGHWIDHSESRWHILARYLRNLREYMGLGGAAQLGD